MQPNTQRIVDVIKSIPTGRVMTYGQIAACAGNPRGARQVARVLHAMSRAHSLPWHRVVNAKGEIALGDAEGRYTQMTLLEMEGVLVGPDGRIRLSEWRYDPEEEER